MAFLKSDQHITSKSGANPESREMTVKRQPSMRSETR